MYLGHNFDKVTGFKDSVARGIEENLTWRKIREGVLPILQEDDIWFTNYFMGLQDGPTNVGQLTRTEGFELYEQDCWDFFRLQVALQRPRRIAVLGKEVTLVLGTAQRLNVPEWAIPSDRPYGRFRFVKHKKITEHQGVTNVFDMIAVYHPAYGRSSNQLSKVLEDSTFLSQ